MKHITERPHGYEVLIKRRDLKWRAVVPYSRPDALAEAVKLRDRFYKICGPITRRHARSNTDVVGVTETTHWRRGNELRCFIVGVGNMQTGWKNRRFYFGPKRPRAVAFQAAVEHRAKAIGVEPATLLPQWL